MNTRKEVQDEQENEQSASLRLAPGRLSGYEWEKREELIFYLMQFFTKYGFS